MYCMVLFHQQALCISGCNKRNRLPFLTNAVWSRADKPAGKCLPRHKAMEKGDFRSIAYLLLQASSLSPLRPTNRNGPHGPFLDQLLIGYLLIIAIFISQGAVFNKLHLNALVGVACAWDASK